MKFLPAQILYFTRSRTTKRNFKLLFKFLFALTVLVVIYSVLFHFIMLFEEKEFSWITGFYWTLTVMSTLGFGDITFASDLGKAFTMLVLMSGIIFLLVMLPFTFIQFFYAPWLEAQARAKTPRELPKSMTGHVILTRFDPITINLVEKLKKYNYDYAIIATDLQRALELYDLNYKVVVGDLGDPETYRRLRIQNAAMLIANNDDMVNTNIAFTVREISKNIPVVTNADAKDSIDILQLAGSTYVFQFMKMLGESLARRTLGMSMGANVIGKFDQLLIAEAPAMRTPLEGKTLIQSKLREKTGVTVVGLWERGRFTMPQPQTRIASTTVLVLAGSAEQLKKYDEVFSLYGVYHTADAPVLILGGGRVGRAAAQVLEDRQIIYKVVEKKARFIQNNNYIEGNAADLDTLKRAGIQEATSVIITTHDDSMNIYLTIYCRQLRSDIQIVSRANLDRNMSKLHSAGADLVMSHASMGANTIINLLKPNKILMFAEGLYIFRTSVHATLVGKSLTESQIRKQTGCSVIAIGRENKLNINPEPSILLEEQDEMILIGTTDAEKCFMDIYQ
ncbi:TrkA family potassium uptake protein [Desulfobacula sp.]|uniref:potassium channel family protein n=1 Tax=Desulfobacula sp. TaxID=2593537 RepID=UPI0025C6F42F|nr:NAD-binding protein [Desulfobacula sp.]MBC2705169.1 NAD-binding protein [Desulfobacula sp.]